ncbi:MAG: flagellar biosynthesis protein FlhB [Gammaproteobacteria bacterium]|nr:flagellar biosynthesis protein FlhB [Gammaproteobacteria bacterium]
MAENDAAQGQERTEEATPKRREDVREKGDTPRSRELNTMMMLMVGASLLLLAGGHVGERLATLFRDTLTLSRQEIFSTKHMFDTLMSNALDAIYALAPFLAVTVVIALGAPLVMGGWVFNPGNAAPKFSRLNPLSGIKRVFGVQGIVEAAKALLKFLLVGVFAIAVLYNDMHKVLQLGRSDLGHSVMDSLYLVGKTFLIVSTATIVIAMFDAPFQLWQFTRKLRMTKQEVREEMKDMEGKPEVKSKIRQKQQEVAMRRMMEEVPKADVVITNPTHFAVALKYDADRMSAPRVVAKGADLVAGRIREIAAANNVMLMSAPPLARALFHSTKLNQEIPAGLYVAVAQVLAYVFQLKQGADVRPPQDLPIPDELAR